MSLAQDDVNFLQIECGAAVPASEQSNFVPVFSELPRLTDSDRDWTPVCAVLAKIRDDHQYSHE
jgi:hypothetical protein